MVKGSCGERFWIKGYQHLEPVCSFGEIQLMQNAVVICFISYATKTLLLPRLLVVSGSLSLYFSYALFLEESFVEALGLHDLVEGLLGKGTGDAGLPTSLSRFCHRELGSC